MLNFGCLSLREVKCCHDNAPGPEAILGAAGLLHKMQCIQDVVHTHSGQLRLRTCNLGVLALIRSSL